MPDRAPSTAAPTGLTDLANPADPADPVEAERPRLDPLRRRLAADSLALVTFGDHGLQVLAGSGVPISGSNALVAGAACAEVERGPAGTTACGSTPTTTVHVVPLPARRAVPGTLAVVVVLARPAADLPGAEVAAILREALTAPASRAA